MDKRIVAVGSLRRPKLNAVREALAAIGPLLPGGPPFEISGVDVPSGVRHTPLSREEIMAGARQRARSLLRIVQERDARWSYLIGLEGGIDIVREAGSRWVFLENWALVIDLEGRESFGCSGAILLPAPLVKRVVDQGIELSEAIDDFAGQQGIRDTQGAWGVLTGNLITRQDAFRTAVISAFAPFFPQVSPSNPPVHS